MRIKLTRLDATDQGIFGKLSAGDFHCVTLERHDIFIPPGVYKVIFYNSPAHKCLVPMLEGVPGRSYIEIHWGNWEKDSKGCILVGTRRVGAAIEESKKAFTGLMAALKGQLDIDIEVI